MANRSDIISANGKRYRTTDQISPYRINNLDASKITSGTLNADRVPALNASKISSGYLDMARLPLISRTYHPVLEVGGISVSTGDNTSQTSTTGKARARTPGFIQFVTGSNVTANSGYDYKYITYTSAGVWVSSSEDWLSGMTAVPECSKFRLLVKNDSITDFTGVTNDFIVITDYATVQVRFDQVFAEIENIGGLPSAEGMSF